MKEAHTVAVAKNPMLHKHIKCVLANDTAWHPVSNVFSRWLQHMSSRPISATVCIVANHYLDPNGEVHCFFFFQNCKLFIMNEIKRLHSCKARFTLLISIYE